MDAVVFETLVQDESFQDVKGLNISVMFVNSFGSPAWISSVIVFEIVGVSLVSLLVP